MSAVAFGRDLVARLVQSHSRLVGPFGACDFGSRSVAIKVYQSCQVDLSDRAYLKGKTGMKLAVGSVC